MIKERIMPVNPSIPEIYRSHENVLMNRHLADLNPLLVGYENCIPGKKYGPTIRQYTLIHYVTRGEGYVIKDGVTHRVMAGQAFLIHAGEKAIYGTGTENAWSYQWVCFDGALAERFRALPDVIPFPSGLIQEMLDTLNKELPEYRIASLLFRMYAELFEGKQTGHHYVRKVQDYIHALYMKPITVEEIARHVNLNRRYLSRIFKEKTGMTTQAYLVFFRIETAKKHLLNGFSVEEAARLCGYEDPSNFSKIFKKKTGTSPYHWKMLQEKQDQF